MGVWVGGGSHVSFDAMPAAGFAHESPSGTPARRLGRRPGLVGDAWRGTQPGEASGGSSTDAGARVEKNRGEDLNGLLTLSASKDGIHGRGTNADGRMCEMRCAGRLAAEGAAVLVTDVKDEVGKAVVRSIVESGGKASWANLGVASQTDWEAAVGRDEVPESS